MKKKLMTLVASVMAAVTVLSTGITANAMGDQSSDGKVPVAVTPGGVYVYGCYYDLGTTYSVYTTDFPVEYLMAIDAAGITNEMSDYEKCVRINDYLCAYVEFGDPGVKYTIINGDGKQYSIDGHQVGVCVLQYGKGVCKGYADAFQTMTSMLGIKSYLYSSQTMEHSWNAVDIDGVRYFVDVLWNDCVGYNKYLMSTELWDDHNMTDIRIGGASLYGWEVQQAEDQARMEADNQREARINAIDNYIYKNYGVCRRADIISELLNDEWISNELTELGLTMVPNRFGGINYRPISN